MRWIRRLFTVLGLLLVTAIATLAWYVQQTLPRTDGTLPLAGLSAPVQVKRDASDVTHILASRPTDAWKALGYVHAQERGWQLEFNRRVMRGALSEVLGPATLETDKLMRTLGIRTAAQRQHAALPADAKAALRAYSDGVNAFFAGMLALSVVFSSYASEVLLSAFRAIPKGQYEAGSAVGLSRRKTMSLVIIPQLIRIALPGLSNLWLVLLKDTALVSVIGLTDILRQTGVAARVTKEAFLFYGLACLIYLVLASISSIGLNAISRWANRSEASR